MNMEFNESKIVEFVKKFFIYKDIIPVEAFVDIETFLEQALLDKEQEVLKRVYGCLDVATLDLDAVASFITITRNDIKEALDKEFKQ